MLTTKLAYLAFGALLALLTVFEQNYLFLCLFFVFLFYLYKWKKFKRPLLLIVVLLYGVYLAVGHNAIIRNVTGFRGDENQVPLTFVDQIKIDGNQLTAIASASPRAERVVLKYRIRSAEEKAKLKEWIGPGIACRVAGELTQPPRATNPNAFDYRMYLQRQGIFWIYTVDAINQTDCWQTKLTWIEKIKRFRQAEIGRLEATLSKDSAGIFAALLFGDRSLMDPLVEDAYAKTGTVHLLAISGLHIAMLTGIVYFVLLCIGWTKEKVEYILLTALPIYAILTGLSPSVNRAVLMLLFFLISRKLNLKISPLDILSSAFLLLILITPFIIYQPGFQLSFGVSFALILSSKGIINRFHTYFSKLAAVSFIAQLASLPTLLSYFYEVSPLSIFANLLFVPLFSFVLLPLVIMTYLSGMILPFMYKPLLLVAERLIQVASRMSSSLADLPGATFILGKPNLVILSFYLVVFLVFFVLWENERLKSEVLLWLPLIPIAIQIVLPTFSPYGKIVFIDVGQGDSILIRLPFNKGNYLIDTGGTLAFEKNPWELRKDSFEVGKDVLVPYLKSEGIRSLDKLILTHGDFDHIGGSLSLLEELKITEILMPVSLGSSAIEQEVVDLAKREKTKVTYVDAGAKWKQGKSKFFVVSPIEKLEDKNEGSIVIWTMLGGKSWLFTGDLGELGEEDILNQYPGLKVDVLKVGHHGSKTSSAVSFLNHLQIETAIISVGEKNRYGHPHEEVLTRLNDLQAEIYRTDQDGAIIFTFRGEVGTFHRFVP
ncbi:DNA internalization-related competence protein ComEC/Rec2 [Mesobacillus maritimus]|uniref:DNA internalization-related competence protein ComEC/Rec2 n=1 Tax=Mesobacillus maritimus TaxID=1643336 RepID=UPI002040B9E7|nr:DNA internalization-related competence protein ComEC/Rec2 [Mesobacillus maritimus]MCM3588864.1 DNA internalization-related competence protein ComEC/Rec2 [Mesobacillus maritimus]